MVHASNAIGLVASEMMSEYVFGVSAVDRDGNESLVSVYVMPPRRKRTYQIKK